MGLKFRAGNGPLPLEKSDAHVPAEGINTQNMFKRIIQSLTLWFTRIPIPLSVYGSCPSSICGGPYGAAAPPMPPRPNPAPAEPDAGSCCHT